MTTYLGKKDTFFKKLETKYEFAYSKIIDMFKFLLTKISLH